MKMKLKINNKECEVDVTRRKKFKVSNISCIKSIYENNKVDEFEKKMIRGEKFPPLLIKYCPNFNDYVCFDGEHRLRAIKRLNIKYVEVFILNGNNLKRMNDCNRW